MFKRHVLVFVAHDIYDSRFLFSAFLQYIGKTGYVANIIHIAVSRSKIIKLISDMLVQIVTEFI